ncbi:MAG: heavy-metal-associated domain-containing protein [Polaribacter sp.]|jgi:copper chaperone|nr:heavy-metal-associated domain-containing protein [Polaribacter sp.]MBT4780345.1 heavy-metal-associated domain-containing protein [Polaribacter sp.]MBT5100101.1 heavy-metal-associated domain-containing protein [Polaribacter sp.]MBT5646132.1 heavy-metal-associated domain-containing protein [Polaribacter sp.]MBT7704119.1 heavy-metal-associated domain-containing protein [Polaribacter sp.]MDA9092451.1 heavy-metal-associated domain-containing protein [Polaribacter sp.]
MIVIKIENLKCGGCAATIKKGLLSIENVDEVVVDVENDTVSISSKNVLIDLIKEKLSKLGYPEVGDKNTLVHKAKSFVSCAVGRIDA